VIDFAQLTFWQWVAVFIGALLIVFNRRKIILAFFRWTAPKQFIGKLGMLPSKRDLVRVRDDLADEVGALMTERIISRILKRLPLQFAAEIAKLNEEIRKLRAEAASSSSSQMLIGVHLRGYKPTEDDKGEFYVPVYISTDGKLVAPQDAGHRKIVRAADLKADGSPFANGRCWVSSLGAPWFSRVIDLPHAVVMLGETYKLLVVEKKVEAV